MCVCDSFHVQRYTCVFWNWSETKTRNTKKNNLHFYRYFLVFFFKCHMGFSLFLMMMIKRFSFFLFCFQIIRYSYPFSLSVCLFHSLSIHSTCSNLFLFQFNLILPNEKARLNEKNQPNQTNHEGIVCIDDDTIECYVTKITFFFFIFISQPLLSCFSTEKKRVLPNCYSLIFIFWRQNHTFFSLMKSAKMKKFQQQQQQPNWAKISIKKKVFNFHQISNEITSNNQPTNQTTAREKKG